jgi:hypothetical protein
MAQAARQETISAIYHAAIIVRVGPSIKFGYPTRMIFFNALCLIAGHLVVDYHSFGLGNKWVREMGPTVIGSAIHN